MLFVVDRVWQASAGCEEVGNLRCLRMPKMPTNLFWLLSQRSRDFFKGTGYETAGVIVYWWITFNEIFKDPCTWYWDKQNTQDGLRLLR